MTQSKKQEYTRRITQANKTGLITIIYDIALEYLQDAQTALSEGDKAEFDRQIGYAAGCIDELIRSLDLKYEIARNLLQLYLFIKKELIHAVAAREVDGIFASERILQGLHETYLKLEKMDNDPPIMSNTQTVYAGMTYGRHDITENVSDPSGNRGFMA